MLKLLALSCTGVGMCALAFAVLCSGGHHADNARAEVEALELPAVDSAAKMADKLVGKFFTHPEHRSVDYNLEDDHCYSACMRAAYRVLESERPDAVIVDPLAPILAGKALPDARAKAQAEPGKDLTWLLAIRTKFFDNVVEEFLSIVGQMSNETTSQIVHLGAGMDSRPFRLNLPANTTYYEIELPAVLALKEGLLRRASAQESQEIRNMIKRGNNSRRTVHYNLERRTDWLEKSEIGRKVWFLDEENSEDLFFSMDNGLNDEVGSGWELPLLNQTDFNVSLPTCWLLEGLTYYISDDVVVRAILSTMRSLSAVGSVLVMDVVTQQSLMMFSRPGRETNLTINWQWGTDTPEYLLEQCGWNHRGVDVVPLGHPTKANFGRLELPEEHDSSSDAMADIEESLDDPIAREEAWLKEVNYGSMLYVTAIVSQDTDTPEYFKAMQEETHAAFMKEFGNSTSTTTTTTTEKLPWGVPRPTKAPKRVIPVRIG